MGELATRDLGMLSYADSWRLQLALLEKRVAGQIPDTLLFVQHPSVITLGRKTPGVREGTPLPTELAGIPVHVIERGGEATYHGPGQLVVYPILRLNIRFGPKALLRLLEESLIELLANYGLRAFWQEGKTGVWLEDGEGRERKIASLGIAVRHGVSYHGLALNVNNDLAPFSLIQPCGFSPLVMTRMADLLTQSISVSEVSVCLDGILRRKLEKDGTRPRLEESI